MQVLEQNLADCASETHLDLESVSEQLVMHGTTSRARAKATLEFRGCRAFHELLMDLKADSRFEVDEIKGSVRRAPRSDLKLLDADSDQGEATDSDAVFSDAVDSDEGGGAEVCNAPLVDVQAGSTRGLPVCAGGNASPHARANCGSTPGTTSEVRTRTIDYSKWDRFCDDDSD